nr:hypothetical protein BaRGS_017946 [Batillaria attramentaria]
MAVYTYIGVVLVGAAKADIQRKGFHSVTARVDLVSSVLTVQLLPRDTASTVDADVESDMTNVTYRGDGAKPLVQVKHTETRDGKVLHCTPVHGHFLFVHPTQD